MSSLLVNGRKFGRLSAAFVTLSNARDMASSAHTKPERLSKNISFQSAFDSSIEQAERPMVLLYGWLLSKPQHIHKYRDYYLTKGFDVLHVKIEPIQLLWPNSAQNVIQQVLNFFDGTMVCQTQPVLVHGFSVGAYLYGETLVKMLSDPQKYEPLGKRFKAQILDSPADVDNVPLGVGRAVTRVPVLQKLIKASLDLYLNTFSKQVLAPYKASSQTTKSNPFCLPSLFLYSLADPVGAARPIEDLMVEWRARGFEVYGKCWEDSPHVSHMVYHPVEYVQQLNHFLERVGLVKVSHQDSVVPQQEQHA